MESDQVVVRTTGRGRIVTMGSAYDVGESNRGRDVVVNASYCGVLPARFIGEHLPRASIGVDCGVGPAGAAVAGLWYLEALGVAAAAADVDTVRLGDGLDLYESGILTFVNQPAADAGVTPGMSVRDAAEVLLAANPGVAAARDVHNRTVVEVGDGGRRIVCTDSIAFALPEDRGVSVLLTAGHSGLSAVPYLRAAAPLGFVCSDGGMGRERAGVASLDIVGAEGIPGAAVDARRARMGDGLSTWHDGVISATNQPAAALGVAVGMTCQEAARLMLAAPSENEESA